MVGTHPALRAPLRGGDLHVEAIWVGTAHHLGFSHNLLQHLSRLPPILDDVQK